MKPQQPGSPEKKRILVVDDHPLYREGVVQLISRQPGLVCGGQAANPAEALAAVAQEPPDLVLLDLRLSGGDGLELLAELHNRVPALPILVLSQCDELLFAERAMRAGAQGYVMKERATDEVLAAIHAVLAGEIYVSPQVAMRVMHKLINRPSKPAVTGVETLSSREFQVFQLLGAGLSAQQIAASLKRSRKTVAAHKENIKRKLGIENAAALARYAAHWLEGGGAGGLSPRVSP